MFLHHSGRNTEKTGSSNFQTLARISSWANHLDQIVAWDILYHPTLWIVQKYTGDKEICRPQNGQKTIKIGQIGSKWTKVPETSHFAGHISPYPLYIFAWTKVWDGRGHLGLQSDGLGLPKKVTWQEFEKSDFQYFGPNDAATWYFDPITCLALSASSSSTILSFGSRRNIHPIWRYDQKTHRTFLLST